VLMEHVLFESNKSVGGANEMGSVDSVSSGVSPLSGSCGR
jgi:hypothetical protein